MIRAYGQLEAFEENIFLHFLLLNSENLWFNAVSYCISIQQNLAERFFCKTTDGSCNAFSESHFPELIQGFSLTMVILTFDFIIL